MEEAVAQGRPFRVVLTDFNMPGMSGLDLTRSIRENPRLKDVEVMLLSSSGPPADSGLTEELGLAAYLVKPVRRSDLLNALQNIMGADPEVATLEGEPLEAFAAAGPSLRILLAEDNRVNQMVAREILERAGHTVRVANHGREALGLHEQEEFEIILMDLRMPEMDGFEATAAIRERERQTGAHIPIIALTANAMKQDEERCLEAGMDAHASKPIRPEELLSTISRFAPTAIPSAEPEERERPPVGGTFDLERALEPVGGDMDLLRRVMKVSLDDAPGMLADAKGAVAYGDPEAIRDAGHALKGMVRNFGADEAAAASLLLEQMGETGSVSGAEAACGVLEQALARLTEDLRRFCAADR